MLEIGLNNLNIIEGFYWEDRTREYLAPYTTFLYEERQKVNKFSQNPNPGLDFMYKRMMVSLIGGFAQSPKRSVAMCKTDEQWNKMTKGYEHLISLTHKPYRLNEKESIYTITHRDLEEDDDIKDFMENITKSAITRRPWIINTFVYSYARKKLRDKWKELESQNYMVIYCDTDSLIFVRPDNTPTNYTDHSQEMGEWELEFKDKETFIAAPKSYGVRDVKLRFKGLSFGSSMSRFFLISKSTPINLSYNNEQFKQIYLEGAEVAPGFDIQDLGNNLDFDKVKMIMYGYDLLSVRLTFEKGYSGITRLYKPRYMKCITWEGENNQDAEPVIPPPPLEYGFSYIGYDESGRPLGVCNSPWRLTSNMRAHVADHQSLGMDLEELVDYIKSIRGHVSLNILKELDTYERFEVVMEAATDRLLVEVDRIINDTSYERTMRNDYKQGS
jgi:hypothetical protein